MSRGRHVTRQEGSLRRGRRPLRRSTRTARFQARTGGRRCCVILPHGGQRGSEPRADGVSPSVERPRRAVDARFAEHVVVVGGLIGGRLARRGREVVVDHVGQLPLLFHRADARFRGAGPLVNLAVACQIVRVRLARVVERRLGTEGPFRQFEPAFEFFRLGAGRRVRRLDRA